MDVGGEEGTEERGRVERSREAASAGRWARALRPTSEMRKEACHRIQRDQREETEEGVWNECLKRKEGQKDERRGTEGRKEKETAQASDVLTPGACSTSL